MENIKEYLKKEILEEIQKIQGDIKKSNEEIKIWEAKIKVEERLEDFKDLNEEMENDVKYGILALKDFLLMERNKIEELNKEFELLRRRKQVLDKFEEQDL